MSFWTFVKGTIEVTTLGRTQEEIEYILKTVLRHLPKVSGSERDMNTYLIKKEGLNSISSHNEFGELVRDFEIQENYIIVVDGSLRDRKFNETYYEFQKWICRLAKRVLIQNVLIEISGFKDGKLINKVITDPDFKYMDMFEYPTWSKYSTGEPNWCEYLLWQKMNNCDFPAILGYKYFEDKENDKKVEDYLGIKYYD